MIQELQQARESMNNSQRKVFDLCYHVMPTGSVSNYTLAVEGGLSYNARKTEINRILAPIGWAIVCSRATAPGRANTRLYSLDRIKAQPDLPLCGIG